MKHYIKLILILAIPLAVVVLYAASGMKFPFEDFYLESIDLGGDWFKGQSLNISFAAENEDENEDENEELEPTETVPVDSTHKRILFFGDSMVEGLSVRMADYARENGYELYSVSWYASTTLGWASHLDSLQNWIAWSNPDFVMVSIGGNELETKDTKRRTECIQKIMHAIGSRPCVWIGTPSWVPNPTITDIERDAVGARRFFNSNHLNLKRAPDHMHPTFPAYAEWMDSVAVWMRSQKCETPIRMNVPSGKGPRIWHQIVLDVHGKRKGAAPVQSTETKTEDELPVEEEIKTTTEPIVEPLKPDSL